MGPQFVVFGSILIYNIGPLRFDSSRAERRGRPDEAVKNYWYFFLFFIISVLYSVVLLAVISFLRYRRNDTGDKRLPYECGVEPATLTAHESYSIRFYLLTLVFIVFEVETFFLFPWAVVHDKLKLFGLIEVFVFLGILILGYFYAWKAEALDFRRGLE